MTLENAKKWYKIFKEQGRLAEAEDIAKKRPEVLEEEEVVEEEKPKEEVKSKKGK